MYETGELAEVLGVDQPDEAPQAPQATPASGGPAPLSIENRLS
jgi:hypothetical protein